VVTMQGSVAYAEIPSENIPQTCSIFASKDAQMLPDKVQTFQCEQFNRRLFSPWDRTTPRLRPGISYFIDAFRYGTYYGENKQPITPATIQAIIDQMDGAHFPCVVQRAITIRVTALRVVPTFRPFYLSFEKAGEGFPFDYAQESGLDANVPVAVIHYTKDKSWALVETGELTGWVPCQDLARVSRTQARIYKSKKLGVVVRDNVPLHDRHGNYTGVLKIGMVLPTDFTGKHPVVLIAKRQDNGAAFFEWIGCSTNAVVPQPLPLSSRNLAMIADRMMGQNYGWGDLFGDRDCASLVQDLYVPFGIWLPRNGNDQGQFGGTYFSLKDLGSDQKEQFILANGIPFGTLLWLKGHIMVYAGKYNGRALVFHNIWGIRTKLDGKEGRFVIGKAVLTTLTPSRVVPNADPSGDLLSRVESMTVLVPKFY